MTERILGAAAVDLGNGHLVELIQVADATVTKWLWEHDTTPGYLSPSIHCDPSRGGCGMHGFVTAGVYR